MRIKIKRNLDIIIPVYNEEQSILVFFERLYKVVSKIEKKYWSIEIIFVNDGSTDKTYRLLNSLKTAKIPIKIANLSKNYGHQQAVSAGINLSRKDSCILILDADLQDPLKLIPEFLEKLQYSDVVTSVRKSRNDSFSKKVFANIFYHLMYIISDGSVMKNSGDYWALSERAKIALKEYPENLKFFRGLVMDIGFKREVVNYDRDKRFAGTTHYSLFKMIQLAIAGITGFSIKPLVYSIYLMLVTSVILLTTLAYLIITKYLNLSQYSSEAIFFGSITIFTLALIFLIMSVLFLYIARIAIETKNRPSYQLESFYEHKE